MQRRSKPLLLAILLPLVAILPCVAQEPQGHVTSDDRHVFVWRGQGGQIVEIEAALGPRGFLGINLIDLTAELREHFGVPVDRGVMISRVLADSPAQKAGLETADIVTAVGGRSISGGMDLSMSVVRAEQGEVLTLEYWRDRNQATVDVSVELHERSRIDIAPLIQRRIMINSPEMLRLHRADSNLAVDKTWLEEVVARMTERFSESDFQAQLEAMRVERTDLHEKLRLMEQRLEELESELHLLNDDNR